MRGVRGKRGVSPLLGLCAVFQHSVGRVHLPSAINGTWRIQIQKRENAMLFCPRFYGQIAQDQRGKARITLTDIIAG